MNLGPLLRLGHTFPLHGRLLADFKREGPPVLLDPATGGELAAGDDRPAFILSTENEATDGHILRQYWDLTRADASGPGVPLLWAHDRATESPDMIGIGTWQDLRVEAMADGPALVGRAWFDPEDAFSQKLRGKVRRGLLRAVSVGWGAGALVRRGDLAPTDPLYKEPQEDMCGDPAEGYVMGTPEKPNRLYEASLVPVPSDARAVATQRLFDGGMRAVEQLQGGGAPRSAGDYSRLLAWLARDPTVMGLIERMIAKEVAARMAALLPAPPPPPATPAPLAERSLDDLFRR